MANPNDRLNRHLIGQGIGAIRPDTERLFERSELDVGSKIELPAPRAHRGSDVRKVRPGVEAGPNAPLLVRLVRTPFRLDPGFFQRKAAPSRRLEAQEARAGYRAELDQVLQRTRRPDWPRPTDSRYRLEPRARVTLDGWLEPEDSA